MGTAAPRVHEDGWISDPTAQEVVRSAHSRGPRDGDPTVEENGRTMEIGRLMISARARARAVQLGG